MIGWGIAFSIGAIAATVSYEKYYLRISGGDKKNAGEWDKTSHISGDTDAFKALKKQEEDERKAHADQISAKIQQTDIIKDLESNDEFVELPFLVHIPEGANLEHSLINSTLKGPHKLAVAPRVFIKKDRQKMVAVFHLGRSLCGHKRVVHGGMIATMFDEMTARPALLNLPRYTGFTAYLNVNYRLPVLADQVLTIECGVDRIDGRKVFVKGVLKDHKGSVLSDCDALFVSPKDTSMLPDNSVWVKKIEKQLGL
ncbi:hypothetical protein H4219_000876 [Mycoemilia scoparia]|uniref:Thioesterase domain-containing protein n=1 Tax=Mycoemilia scoparia TaxID=417184 RepID=A0A9W8A1K4_9FUNG|nr:hypothetical protein H4219_000876 [Mycoemilia scoparia]